MRFLRHAECGDGRCYLPVIPAALTRLLLLSLLMLTSCRTMAGQKYSAVCPTCGAIASTKSVIHIGNRAGSHGNIQEYRVNFTCPKRHVFTGSFEKVVPVVPVLILPDLPAPMRKVERAQSPKMAGK